MKNYELDETSLSAWLPWGGLMNSCIQRNKDGSFIGIINLVRSEQDSDKDKIIFDFSWNAGWCIWHEFQHYPEYVSEYIFVVWNPLYVQQKGKILSRIIHTFDMPKDRLIWNTLTDIKCYLRENKAIDYFQSVLNKITNVLNTRFSARILKDEEIINALASVISMQKENFCMPTIPLYFDVICSDVDFKMRDNDIVINNNMMSIISVPALHHFSSAFKEELLARLSYLPYRLSMRTLLISDKMADKHLNNYINSWCRNRKVVRNAIRQDVIKDLNGYFSNTFIFFNDDVDKLDVITENAISVFRSMAIAYVVERTDYKTVWWSSLPGMFRAKENYTVGGCTTDNFICLYS